MKTILVVYMSVFVDHKGGRTTIALEIFDEENESITHNTFIEYDIGQNEAYIVCLGAVAKHIHATHTTGELELHIHYRAESNGRYTKNTHTALLSTLKYFRIAEQGKDYIKELKESRVGFIDAKIYTIDAFLELTKKSTIKFNLDALDDCPKFDRLFRNMKDLWKDLNKDIQKNQFSSAI